MQRALCACLPGPAPATLPLVRPLQPSTGASRLWGKPWVKGLAIMHDPDGFIRELEDCCPEQASALYLWRPMWGAPDHTSDPSLGAEGRM